jgi:hypothetical protein
VHCDKAKQKLNEIVDKYAGMDVAQYIKDKINDDGCGRRCGGEPTPQT